MKFDVKPNSGMQRLHDDLNKVLSEASRTVSHPDEKWSHRQQACRIVTEAINAKVSLCELGVWPIESEGQVSDDGGSMSDYSEFREPWEKFQSEEGFQGLELDMNVWVEVVLFRMCQSEVPIREMRNACFYLSERLLPLSLPEWFSLRYVANQADGANRKMMADLVKDTEPKGGY